MNIEAFDDVNGVRKVAEVCENINDGVADFSIDWFSVDVRQNRCRVVTVERTKSENQSKREKTHPRL